MQRSSAETPSPTAPPSPSITQPPSPSITQPPSPSIQQPSPPIQQPPSPSIQQPSPPIPQPPPSPSIQQPPLNSNPPASNGPTTNGKGSDCTLQSNSQIFLLGPPRQLTALARKAYSYQRRQWFTNLCCISACPLIMVLVSTLLGNFIASLVLHSIPAADYLYCSKENASDSFNVPYWSNFDPHLPSTNSTGLTDAINSTVTHTNWALLTPSASLTPPDMFSLNYKRPCVYWYGEDYPQDQGSIYEISPGVSGTLIRDSAYLATPLGGWLNVLRASLSSRTNDWRADQQSQSDNTIFLRTQRRTWVVYGADPSVDSKLIGVKNESIELSLAQLSGMPAGPAFMSPQDTDTGIFGTIPTRFFLNQGSIFLNTSMTGVAVPWFVPMGGDGFAIDDFISASIHKVIDEINNLDKSALLASPSNMRNIQYLYLQISKIHYNVPHGGIYIKKIDHINKQYAFDLHFGYDFRLTAASRFPRSEDRTMLQMTQLSNGILRNSNVSKLGRAAITQGLRVFPQVRNSQFSVSFAGPIGGILFPFGVSFLLPIFVIILTQEKESRILIVMKMNGVTPGRYYASHYITFYILYAISVAIFLLSGYIGKLTLFTLTDPAVLLLLFFIWGHNQISLAFFFSSFLRTSRNALVVVFLIVLCSVIVSLALDRIFRRGDRVPLPFFLWTPFAFYRSLSQLNRASYLPSSQPYKLRNMVPGDEVFTALMFMIAEIPVFLGVAGYLAAVLPSDFGVRMPWHFPFSLPYHTWKKSSINQKDAHDPKLDHDVTVPIGTDGLEGEDNDVRTERARIDDGDYNHASPIVINHIRKIYKSGHGIGSKLAIKDVTFAVEEGIVFGLLGPNGAGKTTLLSILTGLYETTSGTAKLAGFDIKTEMNEVCKRIGICPQFDILWDDLTVGDHLYFYARLKGLHKHEERTAVNQALADVYLERFENRQTKRLSGGEKRRLSIAIALLGNPKVVFLDEPTTGLDPEVRRLIWGIINKAKTGKTIVLTTHSMEEAEALCQRISIMAKGNLRCIANPVRLKQIYGSGYHIHFNSLAQDTDRASAFIESVLPMGWRQVDAFDTSVSYEFASNAGKLSSLFKTIESRKAQEGILDWGVGQTTLEEVFIRLLDEADIETN
ncbi:hypothetical protein BASA50_008935 [Batrachochytrium salamandrivorans]|uniref:ABC transporter domain-containing protein n=1 Tax=Batrachochytrium salamandrivorans TaxID=1357716 RepID=A0ABQ8F2C7_9FUNG|nr:hypothetical protein BASA60_008329 [Batrachochytrium salamandrivorans]KAH6590935.1 hypothetical protein BASA50_008935 [Batrachochytrium salamandrivorans]KAJ1343312.1 hypothetical protein BSLG_002338 [Batrachochytrium salamandrivorans]